MLSRLSRLWGVLLPLSAAAAQEPTVSDVDFSRYRARGTPSLHVAFGPLEVPRQAPLNDQRLGLLPRPASTLAEGAFEVRWSETWANVWGQKAGDFHIDYETLLSSISVSYGLTSSLEVEVAFQNRNRFGGELDSVIESWHDFFGLSQNGRDDFLQDENMIGLALTASDPAVLVEESGTISQDLIFRLQRGLTEGDAGTLAAAVTAKWNVGGDGDLDGSSDWDFGISALAARRLGGDVYAYLTVGHQWFGTDNFQGVALEDSQFSILGALEWNFTAVSSVVLQYVWNEAVAETRRPFDESAQELMLGVEYELFDGTLLEIAILENIINTDNSTDFGLHLGVRRRF